ncbi:MAG: polyphosphate polymerase domain-containing protein [Oscillospiraceae bacterium]|jgi:hypothetical protein|nr:polyphosphate polymerase domain-containing protein [Oscillospiraceae bacterium]
MQARHEYKHSISYSDYAVLRSKLRQVMRRDPHARTDGTYRVRSLYFDTPADKALREKIDGVNHREKFRIRRYPGAPDGTILLEKKSKINGLCYKQSAILFAEQVQALLVGDVAWMMRDERPLLRELYTKMRSELLRPKTIVEYIREPLVFLAGNVRVTFDRKICTGLGSLDFLNDDVPLLPAGDCPVLLEVKYDQFLPDEIAALLQLGARRAQACSKYALCRGYD